MRIANVTTQDSAKITWNDINWRTTYRNVNNLRQRIYRATVEGDLKRVRSLQKLQMRSRSAALAAIRQVTQVNQGRKTPGSTPGVKLENLTMLHATCHRQLHSKHGNSAVVSKLGLIVQITEISAGTLTTLYPPSFQH